MAFDIKKVTQDTASFSEKKKINEDTQKYQRCVNSQ